MFAISIVFKWKACVATCQHLSPISLFPDASVELNRVVPDVNLQPWHSCHKLIYVRPNPKTGVPIGHWPIPESFWPDQNTPTLVSWQPLCNHFLLLCVLTVGGLGSGLQNHLIREAFASDLSSMCENVSPLSAPSLCPSRRAILLRGLRTNGDR